MSFFWLIPNAQQDLSNKYESLSKTKKIDFHYYYKNISSDNYKIINSTNLVAYTKTEQLLKSL